MEEKTSKEQIIDFFKGLKWPEMIFENQKINCPEGNVVLFDKKI